MELLIGFGIAVWLLFALAEDETLEDFARREVWKRGNGIYHETGEELAVIRSNRPPVFREDMVRIGGMTKTADLRYRPAFVNWKTDLEVTLIDTGVFDMQSIIEAINLGGYMNGVGEWRMEKAGDFGRFHVELTEG